MVSHRLFRFTGATVLQRAIRRRRPEYSKDYRSGTCANAISSGTRIFTHSDPVKQRAKFFRLAGKLRFDVIYNPVVFSNASV